MKPESKKSHSYTEKSHCNADKTASCYDFSKLSEALKVAELNKIHHNAKKFNSISTIDKQDEIASCYDLSKLSEATEAIVNTSNSNSNVATDATAAAAATQNESDSPFDFTELEEALDAAEEKSKKSLFFRARQVVRKRQQKHLRMYLSTLDLLEWDISDNEGLERTMQQDRNYPIHFRMGRIVEIGAARGRILRSKLF